MDRLERLESRMRAMELEHKMLQLQLDYTELRQYMMVSAPQVDWAELNKKCDEIIKLNEEALAK